MCRLSITSLDEHIHLHVMTTNIHVAHIWYEHVILDLDNYYCYGRNTYGRNTYGIVLKG